VIRVMSDAASLPSLHTARSSQLTAALSRAEQKVAPFPCHSRIGTIWEASGPSGSEYRSDSEAGLTVWKPSDPHLANLGHRVLADSWLTIGSKR
jgi:hypothetical protein